MRILRPINTALFAAITVKSVWDHDGRALFGSVLILVIWAVIWPDLAEPSNRR